MSVDKITNNVQSKKALEKQWELESWKQNAEAIAQKRQIDFLEETWKKNSGEASKCGSVVKILS